MGVVNSPQLWTKNALAEELMLPRQRVAKLLKNVTPDGKVTQFGRPVEGKGRGYEAWYLKTAIPILYGLDQDTPADQEEIDPDRLHPKDRRDWYEGTKTKINLEAAAGALIPNDEVRREMGILVQNIIAEIESIPDLLERNCGADPQMVIEAQKVVDKARQLAYERTIDAEPAESA